MTNDRSEHLVDMSPEGIDRRFRMVEALRKLCISLKQAGEQAAADASRETNTHDQNNAGIRRN